MKLILELRAAEGGADAKNLIPIMARAVAAAARRSAL